MDESKEVGQAEHVRRKSHSVQTSACMLAHFLRELEWLPCPLITKFGKCTGFGLMQHLHVPRAHECREPEKAAVLTLAAEVR